MSDEAQIAEDAALARMLQDEEISEARTFDEGHQFAALQNLLHRVARFPDHDDAFHPFRGIPELHPAFPGRGRVLGRADNSPSQASNSNQQFPPGGNLFQPFQNRNQRQNSPSGAHGFASTIIDVDDGNFHIHHGGFGFGTQQPRQGRSGPRRSQGFRVQDRPEGPQRQQFIRVDGDDTGMLFGMMEEMFGPRGPENMERGMLGGLLRSFLDVLPRGANMPSSYEEWIDFIEQNGTANRGATEEEIESLPTEEFKPRKSKPSGASSSRDAPKASTEKESCAICLEEYKRGDSIKRLPCTHTFHGECVDRWLKVNKTCPCCKQSIRPEAGPS